MRGGQMRRKEGKWGKANAPQTGSRKEPCYAPYTFCYRGQSAKTNNKKKERMKYWFQYHSAAVKHSGRLSIHLWPSHTSYQWVRIPSISELCYQWNTKASTSYAIMKHFSVTSIYVVICYQYGALGKERPMYVRMSSRASSTVLSKQPAR